MLGLDGQAAVPNPRPNSPENPMEIPSEGMTAQAVDDWLTFILHR